MTAWRMLTVTWILTRSEIELLTQVNVIWPLFVGLVTRSYTKMLLSPNSNCFWSGKGPWLAVDNTSLCWLTDLYVGRHGGSIQCAELRVVLFFYFVSAGIIKLPFTRRPGAVSYFFLFLLAYSVHAERMGKSREYEQGIRMGKKMIMFRVCFHTYGKGKPITLTLMYHIHIECGDRELWKVLSTDGCGNTCTCSSAY